MTFEYDIIRTDELVKERYLNLVVDHYRSLFKIISEKAKAHLKAENMQEIEIIARQRLIFSKDGNFYYELPPKKIELRDLPLIYQKEAEYIAGCQDARREHSPSIHEAMRTALLDFRDKLRKSVADSV